MWLLTRHEFGGALREGVLFAQGWGDPCGVKPG